VGFWYWVRQTLFGGTDGSGVGGRVSGIDGGFGSVVIVGIMDMDRIVVVVVTAEWLVRAGSCCCCCRLLGWTGG